MNPVRSLRAEKILYKFFLLGNNGGITNNKGLFEIGFLYHIRQTSNGVKKNYWFTEKFLPGVAEDTKMMIEVKKRVAVFKTPYQKGEILDTFSLGRVFVLDGIIQLAEKDEFIYHEMMAHLPLFSHPAPQKVLIIGGGDGGVLREVLKHPVKEVNLAEIDKKIIEISRKYLPFISKRVFEDKRVKIFIEDGVEFVKNHPSDYFDAVIVDSTDPDGASLPLFSKRFYQAAFNVLTGKGTMIIQGGTLEGQFFQIKKIYNDFKKVFPSVKIYKAAIPAYQESEYGFIVGSKSNLDKMDFKKIKKGYEKLNLKTGYYSPEIHCACSVLPKYIKEKLK